jgi:hypothetical protein
MLLGEFVLVKVTSINFSGELWQYHSSSFQVWQTSSILWQDEVQAVLMHAFLS